MPNIRTLLLDFRHAHDAWVPIEDAIERAGQTYLELRDKVREQSDIIQAAQQEFVEIAQRGDGPEVQATLLVALTNKYITAHREHSRLLSEASAAEEAKQEAANTGMLAKLKRGQAMQALLDYVATCPLEEIDSLARVIDPRPTETAQDEPEAHPS
jgi:hypothetical protein